MSDPEAEPAFGPEDFAARTGVSRETLSQLKAYADVLVDWNARHNLVARSTLPERAVHIRSAITTLLSPSP